MRLKVHRRIRKTKKRPSKGTFGRLKIRPAALPLPPHSHQPASLSSRPSWFLYSGALTGPRLETVCASYCPLPVADAGFLPEEGAQWWTGAWMLLNRAFLMVKLLPRGGRPPQRPPPGSVPGCHVLCRADAVVARRRPVAGACLCCCAVRVCRCRLGLHATRWAGSLVIWGRGHLYT